MLLKLISILLVLSACNNTNKSENKSVELNSEYELTITDENGRTRPNEKEISRLANNITTSALSGDIQQAHILLEKLHNEYTRQLGASNLDSEYHAIQEIPSVRPTYRSARDLLFKNEMLLMTKNGDIDNIPYLLLDIPFDIPPIVEGIVERGYYYYDKKVKIYIEDIEDYNKKCDDIITLAIAEKNKALANKVLSLYKPGYCIAGSMSNSMLMDMNKKPYKIGNGKTVYMDESQLFIYTSYNSQNAAKTRVEEAFR